MSCSSSASAGFPHTTVRSGYVYMRGDTRTRRSALKVWQGVPRNAVSISRVRLTCSLEWRALPPDMAMISPSKNSLRNSAARSSARYSSALTLVTGLDAIETAYSKFNTRLDCYPTALLRAFGHFFQQLHPQQPILEGRIFHRRVRVRDARVEALEDLLVRIVVAFTVAAGEIGISGGLRIKQSWILHDDLVWA